MHSFKIFGLSRFHAHAVTVKNFFCCNCGHRNVDVGHSEDEASRLYSDYRGLEYFKNRNEFAPWYTKKVNDGCGNDVELNERQKTLETVLSKNGINFNDLNYILDHGGDKGQILSFIKGPIKYVYDISSVPLVHDCIRLENIESAEEKFDLVLSCEVLEHVNNPKNVLLEIKRLTKKQGYIYIELPCERWTAANYIFPKIFASLFILFLKILMINDFISTAFRVKFKLIPPFCYLYIREHVQFFSQ